MGAYSLQKWRKLVLKILKIRYSIEQFLHSCNVMATINIFIFLLKNINYWEWMFKTSLSTIVQHCESAVPCNNRHCTMTCSTRFSKKRWFPFRKNYGRSLSAIFLYFLFFIIIVIILLLLSHKSLLYDIVGIEQVM